MEREDHENFNGLVKFNVELNWSWATYDFKICLQR